MSVQYTARIVYGFPAEGILGNDGLDEWVWMNHRKCSVLSAGYYDRPEWFVAVIVHEVDDFTRGNSWMSVGPLLTVSDETVKAIEDARAALVAVDPKVVLGPVGFYLVGSSS